MRICIITFIIAPYVVLLAGCALVAPPEATRSIPPPASTDSRRPNSSRPRRARASSAPRGPWKLEDCIRVALERNPGLEASEWDVQSAASSATIARAAAMPQLSADGGYTSHVNKQPLTSVGGGGGRVVATRDIAEGHLRLHMPLYTGGRIRSEIAAAELAEVAAGGTFARNRKELIYDVSRTYYDILARRRVVKALEGSRDALEAHLEQVESMIANERATTVDRLRTEVRLADIRQELATARNDLETRRYALATIMGMDEVDDPPRVTGELTFNDLPQSDPPDVVDTAYQQREDYRSLRAKVGAQKQKVAAARAEPWPTVNLEASYGDRRDTSDMSSSENVGSAGIGVSLPLFEGGRIRAEVRRQQAELRAIRQRLRELEHRIRLEVRTALNNVSSARERVEATDEAIEQAEESLRTERLRYRNGKASTTDVLDAQADLLDAEKNHHGALAAWNTARTELRLTTGQERQEP